MKNIKIGLLIFALLVFGVGMLPPHSEAFYGNQNAQQMRFQNMSQQDMQHMIQLLTQLRARLQQLIQLRGLGNFDSDVQVITRSATNIEADEALLRGQAIDFNDSDYVDVWFTYGTVRTDLDQDTDIERIEAADNTYFEQLITGLEHDTLYYFRAYGEDNEGNRDYGMILSFRTDDQNIQDEEPVVSTRSVLNVTDESAVLRGAVDMRDFKNGEVFFVYGEDGDQVENITDDYHTYTAIDESGESLQKVLVDSDLDDQDYYDEEVGDLRSDTKHYYRICVGYENQEDETLSCGSVRTFITNQ